MVKGSQSCEPFSLIRYKNNKSERITYYSNEARIYCTWQGHKDSNSGHAVLEWMSNCTTFSEISSVSENYKNHIRNNFENDALLMLWEHTGKECKNPNCRKQKMADIKQP